MGFKKRVMIIVGTRPNFIKITQFERCFKQYDDYFDYVLIHTNQHYDENMSNVFFKQLKLKEPVYLNIQPTSPAAHIGQTIVALDEQIQILKPDAVIVVGDVNSTMAGAIAANKNNVKLFHLESGLRSFDRTMPEEINREITDLIADGFFVTEPSGKENLLKEGKPEENIYFVGNTMIDTLVAFDQVIQKDNILQQLNLAPKSFVLMTMHRPANVDTKEGLNTLFQIMKGISEKYTIVFPVHHRTKNNMIKFGMMADFESLNLKMIDALNYISFQKLIASCKFVLTDSGGIQEETTFRQIPCLTLRNNTERPVTITEGTNELVAYNFESVMKKVTEIENGTYKKGKIPELWDGKATERIVKILKEKI